MEAVKKSDELLSSGYMHRQLQRRLNRFSAAVGKVRARRRRYGNDFIQLLRQLGHQPVVIIGAAHVNELFRLLLNRPDHLGMTVTGRTNGNARVAIEEHVSIDVFNPDSLGAFRHQFERGSRVSRINEFGIGFDNLFALGARQRCLDYELFGYRK